MYRLVQESIKRPVFVTILVLIVALLGTISVTRLPNELLPDINPPLVTVITPWPGASAAEVADLVSEPLEEAAAVTPGVENLQAFSQENVSILVVQFAWGSNVNRDVEELRTHIDQVELPEGAERPVISKFDPASMPILQYVVESEADSEADLNEMAKRVEQEVLPRLRAVDGVADVELVGAAADQVKVHLRQEDLARYGISALQVRQAVAAANLNYPLGEVPENGGRVSFRLTGRLDAVDHLKNLVVGQAPVATGGEPSRPRPVRLSDVADVRIAPAEATSIVRSDGRRTLSLLIFKQADANTVEVADRVEAEIASIEDDLDLTFREVLDAAEIVRGSMEDLGRDLVIGGVLAVLVILLFLRQLHTSLISAISIPVSILATFVVLYVSGLSLNILTLGGLSLAVGLIIDDAIVVIEAVHRHLERGKTPAQAALDGTMEVAVPVLAATATIVAVFLPIIFVPGVAGEIFRELAATVSAAVLVSLAVSLTVVPMLAARLLKPGRHDRRQRQGEEDPQEASPRGGPVTSGDVMPDSWLARRYYSFMSAVLGYRWVALLVAAAILGGSLFLVPHIGAEFIPTTDEGQFQIQLRMPAGSSLEETSQAARAVEEVLREDEHIEGYTVQVGGNQGLAILGEVNGGPRTATFIVTHDGDRDTEEVIQELREPIERAAAPGDVTVSVLSTIVHTVGAQGTGIQVNISAANREELERWVPRIRDAVAGVDGITGVEDNLSLSQPELQLTVDRDRATAYGLTPAQIGILLEPAVKGVTVGRLEAGDQLYDIWLQLREEDRNTVEKLEAIPVARAPDGSPVRLGDVAAIKRGNGPVSIVRFDQRPSATVTGFYEGRDLGSVAADVGAAIVDLDLPDDVEVSYGGVVDLMNDSFSGLSLALVLAVAMVILIMAAEFESYLHPFVILFSLPLAAAGVLAGLWVSGHHFGITAFLGAILLVGIVVRNGIIMIDYIKQLREQGMPVGEAVLIGAAVRVRPVLMTAIAAAVGMLPIALGIGGSGVKLMAPLGVTVVGGLFTSTLLTLVVVPVMYTLLDPAYRREQHRRRRQPRSQSRELPDLTPEEVLELYRRYFGS
ncbi:efflux RND transporter permease subunit [Thermaerobacter litoralis]